MYGGNVKAEDVEALIRFIGYLIFAIFGSIAINEVFGIWFAISFAGFALLAMFKTLLWFDSNILLR